MFSSSLFSVKNVLDKEKALYIINNIGDEFCSLVDQEKKALALAGANGKSCSLFAGLIRCCGESISERGRCIHGSS